MRAPRMVVIGGVGSTRQTLEALMRHRANVVGVFGLRADRAHTTTDHQPLADLVAMEVKRAWDPENVFHFPQSIPP